MIKRNRKRSLLVKSRIFHNGLVNIVGYFIPLKERTDQYGEESAYSWYLSHSLSSFLSISNRKKWNRFLSLDETTNISKRAHKTSGPITPQLSVNFSRVISTLCNFTRTFPQPHPFYARDEYKFTTLTMLVLPVRSTLAIEIFMLPSCHNCVSVTIVIAGVLWK